MLTYKELSGEMISPYLKTMAQIRMSVFHEWPYLYDGSLDYELNYLDRYKRNKKSLCVLCLDQEKVVGITTLMPLIDEYDELKRPLADQGHNLSEIFYYAESCLLPEYRGQGVYHEFFQRREKHVRSFGDQYKKICFCYLFNACSLLFVVFLISPVALIILFPSKSTFP